MEQGIRIERHGYTVVFSDKGNIVSLSENSDHCSVVKRNNGFFGLPFDTGSKIENISRRMKLVRMDEKSMDFENNYSKIHFSLLDDCLNIKAHFSETKGPRTGLDLDFNFLDSDSSGIKNKVMLTDLYMDPNFKYGYFLFRRHDGTYAVMTVNGRFAAYRMKYSYFGHKIYGMQILSKAKDVICDKKRKLPETDHLNITIAFSKNLESAKKTAADTLGISIAAFGLAGGIAGNDFYFRTINEHEKLLILDDKGEQVEYCIRNDQYIFNLKNQGTYSIVTQKNGREHISYVLCHRSWKEYYKLVCSFYKNYFQHKSGAFYRVIYKETLSPEGGRTFEGVHFGNPDERMSCRTGEFGGFAAWAIIKSLLVYDDPSSTGAYSDIPRKAFLDSARRYIENWALHIDNDKPFYGTICRESQRKGLSTYSAYHLYKESNFPQYEIFLMEQLIDYYKITQKDFILRDLFGLANHFIESHIGEKGEVLYHKTDYSTVHAPAILFVKLSKLCQCLGMKVESDQYKLVARNMAEHIIRRGMSFPTEGEGCTEDGSVACSALSILYYCFYVECRPEFLESAKAFLALHKMLELTPYDARMYYSSIRFWETQYETRDYGPSYNAGHAWTLWSSEAKVYYALLTGEIDYLAEAYNGFISNMAKVENNGGMTVSYTPDMIPGTPHHYFLLRYAPLGVFERDTKSYLGMKYPSKTYSATGNYFLIKYEETFNHISGIDIKNNLLINLKQNDGVLESLGDHFNILLLGNLDKASIQLRVNGELKIIVKEKEKIHIENAQIVNQDLMSITINPAADIVTINITC